MEEHHAQSKANGRPGGGRRVGKIVVQSFYHPMTTNIEPSLPFVDLTSVLFALATESPNSRKDMSCWRNLGPVQWVKHSKVKLAL
jgi:hypothetical protein